MALNESRFSSNVSTNETIWNHGSRDVHELSPVEVFIMAYYSIASILSVVGNSLMITAVCKRRPLHKNSFYLISNLAMKDLISALFSTVLVVPGIGDGWMYGHVICSFFGFLSTWLAYGELLLLVAISVDRYFACIYPLRYHELVTHKRIMVGLIFCWTYSLIWALIPFTGFGGYHYRPHLFICHLNWTDDLLPRIYINVLGAFLFYPGTAIIIFCYVKVYRAAQKITKPPVFVEQLQQHETATRDPTKSMTRSRSYKTALTVGLVTGIYFLCWIPFVGIRLSRHFVASFDDIPALLLIEETTMYIFTISHFANPIIYGIYNREFRSEFRKLFKRRG